MWSHTQREDSPHSSKKSKKIKCMTRQSVPPKSDQSSPSSDFGNYLPFRIALAVATGIFLFYLGTSLFLRNDVEGSRIFSDLIAILINGIATLCFFYAAICSRWVGKRIYLAWAMLGIAQFSFTLGDILWGYYDISLQEAPFSSLTDIPYLLFYPLFLIGILFLPSISLNPSERIKMLLDSGIVLIAAVIGFWSLIIAPSIEENAGADAMTLFLTVAYPVMDLVLLFALIDLLFRRLNNQERAPLLLLGAYVLIQIAADSIFMREVLAGTYVSGELLDSCWILGYLLGGLAAVSHVDAIRRGQLAPTGEYVPHYGQLTWPLYIPYIAAGGAFALLVWSHDHPLPLSFTTLALAVASIICLVIFRQVLVLNENASLYREAQEEIDERKSAEKEIIRLNEGLESRVVERTSQLEAANKNLQNEIVERKEAEIALKDSERRLGEIINFLPDPTFVIDKEGKVIAWNRAVENLTGVNAKEILGKGDFEYSRAFYGESRPMLIDLALRSDLFFEGKYEDLKMIGDGTLVAEAHLPQAMKTGASYLYASAAVLYDWEGNIYGAIESMRDITERKKAEENLLSAKEKAESATRAKSEFLANMSHEIRTPMNAVIGMTGLLLETDLKPEQREYLETIRNSGNGLLSIINDILDFSKIDGGKMELECQAFDLRSCIEDSLDLVVGKAAEKGLELIYILEKNVPDTVLGDATRLRQILVNLLGNAVKFTEKGEVVLSATSSQENPHDPRVTREDENGSDRGAIFIPAEGIELHFAVKDTGIGISRDNMNRLFQSFTQIDSSTSRYYGGTGLGLAISRRLVELMGGRIWVESEPGRGSTFHFTMISRALPPKGHRCSRTRG